MTKSISSVSSASVASLFVGIALLAVAALATSCTSPEQFQELAQAERACSPGDQCVIVADCACGTPVNANAEAELAETFATVECCPAWAPCPALGCVAVDGAECVDGRCEEVPSQL